MALFFILCFPSSSGTAELKCVLHLLNVGGWKTNKDRSWLKTEWIAACSVIFERSASSLFKSGQAESTPKVQHCFSLSHTHTQSWCWPCFMYSKLAQDQIYVSGAFHLRAQQYIAPTQSPLLHSCFLSVFLLFLLWQGINCVIFAHHIIIFI